MRLDSHRAASVVDRIGQPRLVLALVVLVLCVLLTGYGIASKFSLDGIPLSRAGLGRYLGFVAVMGVALYLIARSSGLSMWAACGLLAVTISLVAGAAWSLVVVAWFALSSTLVGQQLLKRLPGGGEQSHLIWLIAGAGLYGSLIGILAHFPVNYRATYAMLLALPILIWRRQALAALGAMVTAARPISARAPSESQGRRQHEFAWLELAIGVVVLIHVVIAFVPELGHDALATHLFVPAHLALRHQWGFDITHYVWAVMPMLGDWIFAVAYVLDGESGARLINVGFVIILSLLIRHIAMWAGGTVAGANWGVLFFLSTPLTFTESSSLFIESIWATFLVGGTLLVCRVCADPDRRTGASEHTNTRADLIAAGLLLGLAASAKAVTFTVLPVLFVLLILRTRYWAHVDKRLAILAGLGLFIVFAIAPYAYAYLRTGNPLFPFYNAVFQSPYFATSNFSDTRWSKGLSWNWLYLATFEPSRYIEMGKAYIGAPGFQWIVLLAPAVVLLAVRRERRAIELLLIGLACLGLTTFFIAYLRYVFPALVILCAVIAVAASRIASDETAWWKIPSLVMTMVVGLNLVYLNAAAPYYEFPTQAIFSDEKRTAYLEAQQPMRLAVNFVNQINLSNSPVAIFGEALTAGLAADALHPSWYNGAFEAEIVAVKNVGDLVRTLKKWGAQHILLQSGWDRPIVRALVEKVAMRRAVFGTVSVWTLNREEIFSEELLQSPTLGKTANWRLEPGVTVSASGAFEVTAKDNAVQIVPTVPGKQYLKSVVVSCVDKATLGRLQINWADANQKYLSTSSDTYACTATPVRHTMEATAPAGAAYAYVYASAHLDVPVRMYEVSLKH